MFELMLDTLSSQNMQEQLSTSQVQDVERKHSQELKNAMKIKVR